MLRFNPPMIDKISTDIENIDKDVCKLRKQAVGELIATKFTDLPVVLGRDM